jgi:hypothetical protein
MEEINVLLGKLNNQVTTGIAKKIDGLKLLNAKFAQAQAEFESDPTEENKEHLEEISEFIEDSKEEVVDSLEDLLEAKIERENEEKESQAILKRQADAKSLKERQYKELADKKAKEAAEKQAAEAGKNPEKKKSGVGVFGIIFGGALLIGSLGAINYFRNNR